MRQPERKKERDKGGFKQFLFSDSGDALIKADLLKAPHGCDGSRGGGKKVTNNKKTKGKTLTLCDESTQTSRWSGSS